MSYLFLFFLIMQTVNGQIIITVLDSQENPVRGNRIEFTSEGQILGSCTTSSSGSCDILVEGAGTDQSGLIRGGLTIASRQGQRPVIWPGGSLEVTIRLDENGQVFVPSDHYITPTPESTATVTPESTATVTPESTATVTPESTATVTPESTATAETNKTPSVGQKTEVGQTPANTEVPDKTNFFRILFLLVVIVILSLFTILFFTKAKKPKNS